MNKKDFNEGLEAACAHLELLRQDYEQMTERIAKDLARASTEIERCRLATMQAQQALLSGQIDQIRELKK